MRIAITSASGQLGSAIVQELKKTQPSENILALARTPGNAAHLGVETRKGDYNDKPQLVESLQGVDAVLLVSGNDHPDKRPRQHLNVIEAAKEAGATKVVYTSILGPEAEGSFSPIVNSNRQTEEDIRNSGLDWSIGRNGIYIEPDIEYIEHYKKAGEIANSAGDGRCGYTTRPELAVAYSQMLLDDQHKGHTYNLTGNSLTQQELTDHINQTFGTDLQFRTMSVEEYEKERVESLGEFLGKVISGIYLGIRNGHYDVRSDFETAAGRPHISWEEYFQSLK